METEIGGVNATQHAVRRARERAIPPLIIEWLFQYGEEQPDNRGASVLYFTKRSRRRIAQDKGAPIIRRLHEFLDAYAVVAADGGLITCGHRFQRIYRA